MLYNSIRARRPVHAAAAGRRVWLLMAYVLATDFPEGIGGLHFLPVNAVPPGGQVPSLAQQPVVSQPLVLPHVDAQDRFHF